MARPRKGDVNVSAAIRDYLKANDVGPTEAAAAISKQIGKKVAPSFVSNVKATMNGKPKKKGRRGRKPGRKPGSAAVTARVAHSNSSVDLVTIAAVKELVGRVGVSTAKALIDLLA